MDSILLFPPGASGVTGVGSAIQLGSWLMADPGPDFGAQGLIESVQAQNSMRDGGLFAFRRSPVRKMAFPLIVNTPSVVNWESLLRNYSTPGAYIAVQPEGIPSSQAVYFDVIDGRWEPAYSVFEQRAHVRKGTLHLETQPFGYWPTEILLASSASVGFMGVLPINGAASVIGDMPALARIQMVPTAGPTVTLLGNGLSTPAGVDMVALSLSARPSFNPFLSPAMWLGATLAVPFNGTYRAAPTLAADPFAPASQALFWSASNTAWPWELAAWSASAISSGLEPAYRGRFRVFAFVKTGLPNASIGLNFYTMIDCERAGLAVPQPGQPAVSALATGNQLATAFAGASSVVNQPVSPSNAYETLDMGELTLPPQASGVQSPLRLRWWISGVATGIATVAFGGLYLIPLDGAAGILTRGGYAPSLNSGTQCAFEWNALWNESMNITNAAGLFAAGLFQQPVLDGKQFYRGVAPRVSASTTQLIYLTADRFAGANAIPGQQFQASPEYSAVSVSYRPQFQFLYGI